MKDADRLARILTSTGVQSATPEDLPSFLARLRDPKGPVTWVHARPDAAVIQALDDMGLDEVAVKSLRDGPERPRVEEFADHL